VPTFERGDLAPLQKLDEMGAGDIEEIRRFLRREFRMRRHNRDRIALGHLCKQVT